MNIETVKSTKAFLKANNAKPKPGITMNVYACGHIVSNDEDTHEMAYYPKTKLSNRACPICLPTPRKLVQKFKLCHCGHEMIGVKRQDSKKCEACPKYTKVKIRKVRCDKKAPRGHFTMPVNVFSMADAHAKGQDCIPCSNLFRFNKSMELTGG